ncbi:hypothetical protein C5S29_11290 [ANME-1 cluster archaeon GoMg3.2]|nr:hypothetical protein [ANME-1 cluster archaeon GoMg3.2]
MAECPTFIPNSTVTLQSILGVEEDMGAVCVC